MTALPAYGHTPGHTVYEVESKGKMLVLIGDMVHVEAVQFPDPSVGFVGDSDAKSATAERKKVFAEAAEKGYLIGAAHLAFPGIGHVTKVPGGYRFQPIAYTPLAPVKAPEK